MSGCGILARLVAEYQHSIEKHGDWHDYSLFEIHKAVSDEYNEFTAAVVNDDIDGPHGVKRELMQLLTVCVKAVIQMERLC